MISIVMPAHNEALVIRRTLDAFVPDAQPGEIEVIVVCNGCTDLTAEIARGYGPAVKVVETEVASKANALNLGDDAANAFPRVYMDADVVMSMQSLRRLTAPLVDGPLLSAAPAVEDVFKQDTDWAVRSYYSFWMSLPYVKEGMVAAGVYAVSAAGRARFGRFPDIIADDSYFRLQFGPEERAEVPDAVSRVTAPARFIDLIRIKTRSRLGVYQLRNLYPDMFAREAESKRPVDALLAMLRRPQQYLNALPFILVSLISRRRAARQLASSSQVWERDMSSRTA